MNKKNTSQPHLTFKDDNDDWSTKQSSNSESIQKYKVILKNLPAVQKYKIQKWQNKGVQSLSNLESIIENSLETDLEFIDSDVLDDNLDTIDHIRKLDQNKNILNQTNQYRLTELNTEISTISNLSTQQQLDTNQNLSNQNLSNQKLSNQKRSNKTTNKLNTNYQTNLNNFANLNLPKELNKKSNYKQINNDSNYFFGPIDKDYESQKTKDRTSKNRLINRRQNVCDYMTIFLILTAFISIFVSIILLFLIALNAWSMSTTFTIILIMLCILTVLLVLFASFTANFVWFFNSNSNSIDWMLSYGRKRTNDSNYYFGKSFVKNNQDEETNDTESNLIQQI